ncbi:hypothetical protein, partial [Dietzia cinnamea]|uniref:hypothetical protein n=1 Tax=Dietzia cinnamea TaxID=321318 RepID=UPI0021A3C8ED
MRERAVARSGADVGGLGGVGRSGDISSVADDKSEADEGGRSHVEAAGRERWDNASPEDHGLRPCHVARRRPLLARPPYPPSADNL